MTTQGARRPIVLTWHRKNRESAVILLCLVGVPLVFVSVGGLVAEGISVIALALGIPGLLLLAAAVPLYRWMKPWTDELIFDADGVHFQDHKREWFLAWADITAISVTREIHTATKIQATSNSTSASEAVYYTYLDFWAVKGTASRRPDLASLWQARGALGHFRKQIAKSEWIPGIKRGVTAFRRDLWRPVTIEDHRTKWHDVFP